MYCAIHQHYKECSHTIERRLRQLRWERTRLAWGYESADAARTAEIIEEMTELAIRGARR